ncbi:MAG: type II toxin-antitoxin system VapC family toxin [Candidatus Thermoplasmatota archaeon]|jgi:predicted nucleic acid-binding protein|nr:type II toxin-antitoxin system VapC family toxin [Candidatus Thermoplasmatota archaeon]MCL5988595.1 type II toxin-antitoxin system VapC family toxin [Candidatus Thermoplasmatota archaeon]
MNASHVYLDTSILIKRYVKEENSDIADTYFHKAHQGETVICISEINLGEAAVVFDKYSRKMGIDAGSRLQTMLSELGLLERSSTVEIFPVSSQIIRKAVKTVLEQHIYIVDAIQLETCIEAGRAVFCSADKELNSTARKLGIETAL